MIKHLDFTLSVMLGHGRVLSKGMTHESGGKLMVGLGVEGWQERS